MKISGRLGAQPGNLRPIQATGATLDVALADLDSLRRASWPLLPIVGGLGFIKLRLNKSQVFGASCA